MILRSGRIFVFATGADLGPGVRAIEEARPLRYVRKGFSEEPRGEDYSSALDLPGFGQAASGDLIHEPHWLVWDAPIEPVWRPVPQRRGGVLYMMDEVANPQAMIVTFGGRYQDTALIVTEVMSTSDPRSAALFREYAPKLVKGFGRYREYYLGPEARALWQAGMRLSHSAGSSPLYDLR